MDAILALRMKEQRFEERGFMLRISFWCKYDIFHMMYQSKVHAFMQQPHLRKMVFLLREQMLADIRPNEEHAKIFVVRNTISASTQVGQQMSEHEVSAVACSMYCFACGPSSQENAYSEETRRQQSYKN